MFNGSELTVISAHPPPPRFRKTAVRFDPQTVRQIKALAVLAMENKPAILLGDFNFVLGSDEYKLVKTKDLMDAFHESGRGGRIHAPEADRTLETFAVVK